MVKLRLRKVNNLPKVIQLVSVRTRTICLQTPLSILWLQWNWRANSSNPNIQRDRGELGSNVSYPLHQGVKDGRNSKQWQYILSDGWNSQGGTEGQTEKDSIRLEAACQPMAGDGISNKSSSGRGTGMAIVKEPSVLAGNWNSNSNWKQKTHHMEQVLRERRRDEP